MSSETLNFSVEPTDPAVPLTLAVYVNDQCCFGPASIDKPVTVSHEINDEEEQQYQVRIEMSGKTDAHTKIDDQGNIIKDALLKFSAFEVMGIDIDTVMSKKAKYHHNHNGHSEDIEQTFAMSMGCNGSVEFTFTTPIYLWLLENL